MSKNYVAITEPKKSVKATILDLLVDENGELKWNVYQGGAILAGVVILVFFTMQGPSRWRSLAIGLLIAGSALAAGILIGFLFGIPRTLQKEGPQDGTTGSTTAEAYGVNTNLEQISDWLTKIIVGVGLVQLTVIPGRLKALADYLATAFGTPAVPSAIVITIICYFAIFGFLLGYLWTRIYLMSEFSRVERTTRERPEYYEGLIHAYLYQPMPGGFQHAIAEGEKYTDRFGDNWRVWLYLACAYAQQYSYLSRDPQPNQEEMKAAKDEALNAVKRVLQINQDAKALLRGLWNPQETNPLENDLEIFWREKDTNFFASLSNPGETFPAE
jgi:hypothetical protein